MSTLTPRDHAELVTRQVVAEFVRSGTLPGPLVRSIQAAAWRSGRVLTAEQVEVQARGWVERMLAATVDGDGDAERVE